MPPSRRPRSSQPAVHRQLERVVRRHLESVWRQPIHDHTLSAFAALEDRVAGASALVLDSGCGTGESTLHLAQAHPHALVIGVDKSRHRLARCGELPDNALVVRADLADFWRLARAAGWQLSHHYLYYPNPWPKPRHLQRRWHAHPVFPDVLALGGRLELRTNFELYAREFALALDLAGVLITEVVSLKVEEPVSPFERKYAQSGHALYRVVTELS